ncbi:leucine rich repeat protein [Ichthyophthirius multifiliis]|uniref:Leucine rich repeat protein n=1 Tax=Ichthyophthirius multifiliis TaxID=5932 RepID=G0R1G0_ICHMU|nr:leucine rich repeat protein [Ichthyophthirius multifiliis]EGR28694.1 leucine rich repeat protein [Ichthyophthirius multifiliis]|eukprot:XP_004029930.1 leucine rich repeat protein [Ichthyophthirius multifiliis]
MLAKKLVLARANNQPDPFKKDEFPLLKNIAIDTVAKNFHLYPELTGLPEHIKDIIIQKTTTDLPILITAQNIYQEAYWQRSCKNRWGTSHKPINIEDHGRSWKVAYLERYMEEFLVNVQSADENERKQIIQSELRVAYSWIHTLNIQNTNQPLDIEYICKNLPLLTSLQVSYGLKYTGMEYNRQSIGMKLSEAANLGEAIKNSQALVNIIIYIYFIFCLIYMQLSVSLSANIIDDDLLRFIMAGVNMNSSLIELNLSHNKLEDQGARRLAKFLMRNEILLYLNLSNNLIGYEGSRYFAQALKINKTLQYLSLKLNNLGDKAGKKLFQDLVINKTLQELDVSGNQFDYETALKLSDYIADSMCCLKILVIGNNDFGDSSFETLKIGFTKNYSLSKLDIRGCKFSKTQREREREINNQFMLYEMTESERELTEIILKHDLTAQKIQFFRFADYQEIQNAKQAERKNELEKLQKQQLQNNQQQKQQEENIVKE